MTKKTEKTLKESLYFAVLKDNGNYSGRGFDTREEAEAFEEGIEYCEIPDLSIIGIYFTTSDIKAIARAKSDEKRDS